MASHIYRSLVQYCSCTGSYIKEYHQVIALQILFQVLSKIQYLPGVPGDTVTVKGKPVHHDIRQTHAGSKSEPGDHQQPLQFSSPTLDIAILIPTRIGAQQRTTCSETQ